MKYQYLILVQDKDKIDVNALNKLGSEGYKLIAVTESTEIRSNRPYVDQTVYLATFYFMKEA